MLFCHDETGLSLEVYLRGHIFSLLVPHLGLGLGNILKNKSSIFFSFYNKKNKEKCPGNHPNAAQLRRCLQWISLHRSDSSKQVIGGIERINTADDSVAGSKPRQAAQGQEQRTLGNKCKEGNKNGRQKQLKLEQA